MNKQYKMRLVLVVGILVLGCGREAQAPASSDVPEAEARDGTGVTLDPWAALTYAKEALSQGETEVDLDGDGMIDYRRVIDLEGRLLREEIDLDGDGTPERLWDYVGYTKLYQVDGDQDGLFEQKTAVTLAFPDSLPATVVVTTDRDGDGRPDARKRYVLEEAGEVINIQFEEGTAPDAELAPVYETSTSRIQFSANGLPWSTIQSSGPFACSPAQRERLEKALFDTVTQGAACLTEMDRGLALEFERALAASSLLIDCQPSPEDDPEACAAMDPELSIWRFFGRSDLVINTFPRLFSAEHCQPIESTLFHEVLHYVLGLHEIGGGDQDPADRIWGCERTCFGRADSRSCAACLGARNGDPRCAHTPQVDCENPIYYCPVSQEFFPQDEQCAQACAQGDRTAYVPCQVRGPCRP